MDKETSSSAEPSQSLSYWQQGKDLLACHQHMYDTKLAADVCFTFTQPDGSTEDILAHKYVLISRSPVFETMFSSTWVGSNKITKVAITDISSEAFHEFLRYLYTDKMCDTIPKALVVLYPAHKYQVDRLVAESSNFLKKMITSVSVSRILNTAVYCDVSDLQEVCLAYCKENGLSFLQSSEFLELTREALDVVVRGRLDVESEMQVYDACMRWAKNKCEVEEKEASDENLRAELGGVLCHIRFAAMPEHELETIKKECSLLTQEEKNDILNIRRNMLGTGKFDARCRVEPASCFVCIDRFTDVSVETYYIRGKEEKPTLLFSINKEAKLAGISTYISDTCTVDASLTLYNQFKNVVASVSTKELSFPKYLNGISTVNVLFEKPVTILANSVYELQAILKWRTNAYGIEYCKGLNANSEITDVNSGFTVRFLDDKTSGQIPQLFFLL